MSRQKNDSQAGDAFNQLRHNVERVPTGEIDVKDSNIRPQFLDQSGAIFSSKCCSDDLNAIVKIKQRGKGLNDQMMIVNNHNTHRRIKHERLLSLRNCRL